MNWDTYSSNNQNGLLKFNGPHRGRTAEGFLTGVKHPQVIKVATTIKVGEVKIYGTASRDGKVEEDHNEAK